MRAAVVLLLALCAPAFGANLFGQWMVRHGKTYTSVEEQAMRQAIFNANVAKINAHNLQGESWTMAINEFADLTSQEFAIGRIGGFVPRNLRRAGGESPVKSDLPTSVDWTTKGAVTPVKNQGQCGSCWSFSTTGSVEGAGKIFKGALNSLSEQMLMDCSTAYGNQGCNGGLMDDAFQYIIANGGICSEAAYPYTAQDGTCQTSCSLVSTSAIKSFHDVTVNSDSALATAVAQQPVSVAIEADQSSFQFYSGGVMTAACGTALDHGVLAVGYGTASGVEYWKVKNSWGASWGEAGYIRLARGASYNGGAGQCGIYSEPSYPGY